VFGSRGSASVYGAFGAPSGAGSSKDIWKTGYILIVFGSLSS
jgi:NhaP-type Na+/H+ or K+/H+ antiporter